MAGRPVGFGLPRAAPTGDGACVLCQKQIPPSWCPNAHAFQSRASAFAGSYALGIAAARRPAGRPARLCSAFLTAPCGRCAPARAARLGRRRAGTIYGPGRLRVALSGLAAQAPAEHFDGGGTAPARCLGGPAPTDARADGGLGAVGQPARHGRRAQAWRPAAFLGVMGAGGSTARATHPPLRGGRGSLADARTAPSASTTGKNGGGSRSRKHRRSSLFRNRRFRPAFPCPGNAARRRGRPPRCRRSSDATTTRCCLSARGSCGAGRDCR